MGYPEAASFPGTLFTYQDIPPWSDRLVATLVGDMDASQTTFTISTTTVDGNTLNVPCILTIGNERIKVNTATGAAITASIRGYAGSTAASHSSGDAVRANLTAFHWNRLVAELLALETFIGPNGSSLPASATTFKVSGDGNYTVPAYFTSTSLLEVEMLGGGGGGAGATTNKGGGGGGAGEWKRIVLTGLTAGATITCAYGAAGSAGAINTAGGDGGNTSITGTWTGPPSPITAYGGRGAGHSGDTSSGGDSGWQRTTSVGTEEGNFGAADTFAPDSASLSGGGGFGRTSANSLSSVGAGPNTRDTSVAGAANIYRGGSGGGCPLGYPGQPNTAGAGGAQSTMNATAGKGYGAGGGGGNYDASTAGSGTGSVGQPGCIIFRILKV